MSDTLPPAESDPAAAPARTPAAPAAPARENVPAEPAAVDPTRYGDWEKNGRCIDF